MPIVAWLIIAYLSGLLAGFAGEVVAVILPVLAGLLAMLFRSYRLATLALIAATGSLSARSALSVRRDCVRHALRQQRVVATLGGDVKGGGFARARTACGAPATLFVAAGNGWYGSIAVVTGQVETTDTLSLTIRSANVGQVRPPTLAARLRSASGRSVDRDFGADAPLVRALVLADMQGMSPQIRDRWAAAGMVHMLSVSGMHVAIIAAVVELILAIMRVDRRGAPVIGLLIIMAYVVIIGAPAPAVRSALMLALRALSRGMQRNVSPWAIVGLGALHPVVDPWVVRDLGYQLSVVGVGALIVAGELVDRLELPRRPAWRREALTALVCTVVASIASLPLVAWSIGRVSLIAPLSNLAAGPFIAVAQPMLFLGVLLSPISHAAQFVADASHPLLEALDGIAAVSARVPGASITVWPSAPAAVLTAVATVSILAACGRRGDARAAIAGACGLAVLAWLPPPRGLSATEVHMIDVGQGDAIAIRTRTGRWILFDAGRVWQGGDAGRRVIAPYIAHRGGQLEMFVLSHPHADHVGGAASIIDALRPRAYFDGAFVLASAVYRASLEAARAERVTWRRVHPGDSAVIDEVTVRFLAPDSAFAAGLPDPNNASAAAMVEIGSVRVLMMGDAEREEEEWLVERFGEMLRADVLKVGHHGSSTSSTAGFLDMVRPKIALVSVGAGNTYGHPSPAVMTDLAARGVQVLRTDRLGTVVLRIDGRGQSIQVGR